MMTDGMTDQTDTRGDWHTDRQIYGHTDSHLDCLNVIFNKDMKYGDRKGRIVSGT